MKNKSTRHKSENTFKFIPFAERINNIDIDIFHKVAHEYECQEEENECIFYQTIVKWNVLNLTESYSEFKRDVHAFEIITLPQLIFNKQRVKDALIKHLKFKNDLVLQPLLDLVVALAKDLRQDFYPFYYEIYEILIDLLKSNNSERLEWTFQCLAYLFKFLWRPIIGDITIVFKSLLPLLSESYPAHINNFAAESFAFVARKVKDFKAFLFLILKSVKQQKDGTIGCSRLLYEVVKGITGDFHSCAKNVLPILLNSLDDRNSHQQELFEVLEKFIEYVTENINPSNSALLYSSIISTIETQIIDGTHTNALNLALILLGQSLEYKCGRFLHTSISEVSKMLLKLLHSHLPVNIALSIVKISVILLKSRSINLPQTEASNLLQAILGWKDKEVLLYFIANTFDYPMFSSLVLPTFLQICIETKLNDECLVLLTKLLLSKAPLYLDNSDFSSWRLYSIDFGSQTEDMETILSTFLQISDINEIDHYICATVILPHLKRDFKDIRTQMSANILWICEKMNEFNESVNTESLQQLLFLLISSVECFVHISNDQVDFTVVKPLKNSLENCLVSISTNINFLLALKALEIFYFYLHQVNASFLDMETIIMIHDTLKVNFNSPYHRIRLCTSHIYALFETAVSAHLNTSWTVFSICYQVESIRPQVDTYRDQLQALEKFQFDKPQMQLARNTPFLDVPLRYLCGVLYLNFNLLWDPVIAVITSHALGLDINDFWTIYGQELRDAATIVKATSNPTKELPCKFSMIGDFFQSSSTVDDKPDHLNYRMLLWKAMANFPSVAEGRNQDTVEMFFSFINTEYRITNSDMAVTVNIKNSTETDIIDHQDELADEENSEKVKIKPKAGANIMLTLLLHHLRVLSKVKNPKSMHNEQELYKIYFDFLGHKNTEVQKLILQCLLAYKNKNVLPYATNLHNLIDEKLFKNEVINFKLDPSTSPILQQHRDDVIPIVLKIIYSKMVGKLGGKTSGQQRRNMMLRYLSGCSEPEMLQFMQMAFKFFENYVLVDNCRDVVEAVRNSIDLEKFVPPKRLQSTLNLLSLIFEQFGNLMHRDILTFVLKLLFSIGMSLNAVFDRRNAVFQGFLPIFRNLRTSIIKLLGRFFSKFDYAWNTDEIDIVFDLFICPHLRKQNLESIQSPTAFLKLLGYWASNPRCYRLLVKQSVISEPNEEQSTCVPLDHVVELLMHPKIHVSVYNYILEMIENILKLTLSDGEAYIDCTGILPIQTSILHRLKVPDNKLNYGSCVLLPYVQKILTKMKQTLLNQKRSLNQRDLVILSRISELVWESEICDSTLELLLPILHKRIKLGAKDEAIMQLLATVKNLLLNVDDASKHIRQLSPLFSSIKDTSCRKVLGDILANIASNNESFSLTHELIAELNAYNAKWIDQPDYDRRLAAFRHIETLSNEDKLSMELFIILIYNCFHTLTAEKDLSLRENAIDCLKTIMPALVLKYHNEHNVYILDQTLLPLLKNGFKTGIRSDCISLLGVLARDCSIAHVVLRDLHKLTNKSDLEVDFFENLLHLQLHRQGRALLKVREVFRKETQVPNIRTLTQYILPFATFYLENNEFISKHSIIDSACDVLGTIARLMPWHNYEALLKIYLGKLMHDVEHQKQLVKIVVSILDGYHFDLKEGFDGTNDFEADKTTELVKKIEENEEQKADENNLSDDDNGDDEEETEHIIVKPFEKTTVLSKSSAKRVIRSIRMVLIPQLNRTLAMKTNYESSHKLNQKKTNRIEREDEDLVRIPITIAVVKLLQRLPKVFLDRNLPGLIMKLCTFLKTKLESVRRTARETLQKIVLTLGPDYLSIVIAEMTGLPYKGFQMHVIVFTIHAVLNCMKPHYKEGHIDNVLLTVMDFVMQDLFGALADEREVHQIVNKVSEASSPKSLDTLHILAQFISDKCFLDIVLPFKRILSTSQSFKVVKKVAECLKQIALGLVDNQFVAIDSVLKFAYGTASQTIPDLLFKAKAILTTKDSEKLARQKPDCFVIPKAPVGRAGIRINKVKSSEDANAHILVAFGLKLCHFLLKRDKLKGSNFKSYLDPFIVIVKNSISASYVKLNTISLQCLEWMLKYDLPSLKLHIVDITKSIFAILHKYASAGLRKGDNFDLVVAAFKTMSVLVRDVKYHVIETEQLKVLLLYVEQDLYNNERQASAFGLLKAIIARKLIVPEINDIVMKVGELSITSDLPHVRQQCRIIYQHFLMDYPVGSKLEKYVGFYLAQLGFQLQTGRESALTMIQILINSFPLHVVTSFSGLFLTNLGLRLINDDVPACRRMSGKCITLMMEKLDTPHRDPLFEMIITWFRDKKIQHRTLAAQLCGLLINVEKETFESRIPTLMPITLKQFKRGNDDAPGKFVRIQQEESVNAIKEKCKDHHLFQVIQMLLKLCCNCPNFMMNENIEHLAIRMQGLLSYPHDWVRLGAAQFLGYILSSIDVKKLANLILTGNRTTEDSGFLYSNSNDSLKSLALDLCAQLQPDCTRAELAEQVVKNLILIARVLQFIPISKIASESLDEDVLVEDDSPKRVNLLWLIKRTRRIINIEIVENAKSTVLRLALFRFIAALLTVIDIATLMPLLYHLAAPLVREIVTSEKSTGELVQLAKEITTIIKNKIGKNEYTKLLNSIESKLTARRAERKRQRTQLAVTDPELYAKKKIKHHEKKKDLKRKNVSRRKGVISAKRKRTTEIDCDY